jgi:hypothetical protein
MTTHIIRADVIDEPTTEQYLCVFDLLGIDEAQFRREPTKTLASVADLPTAKIRELLKIILRNYKKLDTGRMKADALQQVLAESISFFLQKRLSEYLRRRLSLMNITDARVWLNGMTDKNLKKLGYIELSQILSRPGTGAYLQ